MEGPGWLGGEPREAPGGWARAPEGGRSLGGGGGGLLPARGTTGAPLERGGGGRACIAWCRAMSIHGRAAWDYIPNPPRRSPFLGGLRGGGGLAVVACTLPCGGGGRRWELRPAWPKKPGGVPWARGPLRGRTSDSPGGTPLIMVWYGMVWYGMVWFGMVRYGMVWYGMVWFGLVWYGMVYHCMVWFHKCSCQCCTDLQSAKGGALIPWESWNKMKPADGVYVLPHWVIAGTTPYRLSHDCACRAERVSRIQGGHSRLPAHNAGVALSGRRWFSVRVLR